MGRVDLVINMKMPILKGVVLFLAVSSSGCVTSVWEAKWGAYKPHISFITLEQGEGNKDRLYVWSPNSNAAYINNSTGVACLASADVAQARSLNQELALSLSNIFGKVDEASVNDKLVVADQLTKISSRGEPSSFLNVASFHICMLAGAEKIGQQDVKELLGKAIDAAIMLNTQPQPQPQPPIKKN